MAMKDDDFSSMALDERLTHSNWRCRESVYDTLKSHFDSASLSNEEIELVQNNFKVFLDEKIAPALEKSSKIIHDMLQHLHFNEEFVSEITSIIIKKLLGNKPKIKENGYEILSKLIEIGYSEPIFKIIINEGIKNSNIKISAASLDFVRAAIESFGSKIFLLQESVKPIISLTEHRDTNVRNSTKQLIATIFHSYGESCKVLFKSVKPVVLKEINSMYDDMKNNIKEIPKEKKCVVTSDNRSFKQTIDGESNDDAENLNKSDDHEEEFDPFDHADEIILQNLIPKTFNSSLNDKSWKIRKEGLDLLKTKLEDIIRLKYDGQLSDIIEQLKNLITKDSNIIVSSVAAYNLSKILSCIRREFSGQIELVSALQPKLKEKKPILNVPICNCLIEAFKFTSDKRSFLKISLENAHQNANPILKISVLNFQSQIMQNMKENICDTSFIESILGILFKLIDDSNMDVRDSAMNYVAIIGKLNPIVEAKLKSLPETKQIKIKDSMSNLIVKSKPIMIDSNKANNIPEKRGFVTKFKAVRPKQSSKVNNQIISSNDSKENHSVRKLAKKSSSVSGTISHDMVEKNSTVTDCPNNDDSLKIFSFDDSSMLAKLDNTKLDIRYKALESLEELLSPYDKIKGQISQLFDVLLRRLSESNKNMTVLSLKVIIIVLSKHAKPNSFINQLFSPIAHSLTEQKASIRKYSVQVLDLLAKDNFYNIKIEYFNKILKSDNKYQINDFLDWIMCVLIANPQYVQNSIFIQILTPILNLLNHKNIDIRSKSTDIIQKLSSIITKDKFIESINCLKDKEKSISLIHNIFQDNNQDYGLKDCISSSDSEKITLGSRSTKHMASTFNILNSNAFSKNTKSHIYEELYNLLPIEISQTIFSNKPEDIQQGINIIIDSMDEYDNELKEIVLSNFDSFLLHFIHLFQNDDQNLINYFKNALIILLNSCVSRNLQLADNSATALIKLLIKFLAKDDPANINFSKDVLCIVFDLTRRSLIIKELFSTLTSSDERLKCECIEEIIQMIENYPYDFNEMLNLNRFTYRQIKHAITNKNESLSSLVLQCISIIVKNIGTEFLKKLSLDEYENQIFSQFYEQYISHENDQTLMAKSTCSIMIYDNNYANMKTNQEYDINNRYDLVTNELTLINEKDFTRISTPKASSPLMSKKNSTNNIYNNVPSSLKEITMNLGADEKNNLILANNTNMINDVAFDNLSLDINNLMVLMANITDNSKAIENVCERVVLLSSKIFQEGSHFDSDNISHMIQSPMAMMFQTMVLLQKEKLNEIENWLLNATPLKKLHFLRFLMESVILFIKYYIVKINSECVSQTNYDLDISQDLISIVFNLILNMIKNDNNVTKHISNFALSHYTHEIIIICDNLLKISNSNPIMNENIPIDQKYKTNGKSYVLFDIVLDHFIDLSLIMSNFPNIFIGPSIVGLTTSLFLNSLINHGQKSSELHSSIRNSVLRSIKSLMKNPENRMIYIPTVLMALDQFFNSYYCRTLNNKKNSHKSQNVTQKSLNNELAHKSLKVANYCIMKLALIYGTYVTNQLKLCKPDAVRFVTRQYNECIKKIISKNQALSSEYVKKLTLSPNDKSNSDFKSNFINRSNTSGLHDGSFDLSNSFTSIKSNNVDSEAKSLIFSNSSNHVNKQHDDQILHDIKDLLLKPQNLYLAIKNLWNYLNETNQKFRLNEIINDFSSNHSMIIAMIFDLYEVNRPIEESQIYSIESLHEFNRTISSKLNEQMGIL